jgi:hypothetical protein
MLGAVAYKEYTLVFSSLRVSTMTTTVQIGTKIDIPKLYESVPLLPYWNLADGILKIQTGSSSKGVSCTNLMKQEKKAKDKIAKAFFNQATLVIRREVSPLYWKEINVKLFKNGGIQMTGVRSAEMAQETLTWLLDHIQRTCAGIPIFEGPLHVHKFQVHLINSDFSIGAPIRRDALHTLLTHTYRLPCLYETTVYQGVKTKYFFNDAPVRPGEEGRCTCSTLCEGNGTGTGAHQCKKITISPFQTGQVIIQASGLPDGSMRHIEQAMKFIQTIFQRHASDVIRKQYLLPSASPDLVDPVDPAVVPTPPAWIPHPTLRHLVTLPVSSLLDAPLSDAARLPS